MQKRILSIVSLALSFMGFSQEVYFKYDEAGNQRYRGTNINGKSAPTEVKEDTVLTETFTKTQAVSTATAISEKDFWSEIRLYPVPVNDILTIDWTDKVDDMIKSVALYQHSTIHWKFQQQNIPELNKKIQINMTGYDWGVYVLRFTLKDGRVFSRNITKR